MYHPHVSNFSSSKDTYAMLVIGPSLPVVRYWWSFSRSRQPLPGHWHFFCLRKFAMNPLPLLPWHRGAEHMFLYHRRRDIWGQPRTPECALIHPTRGREPYQPGRPGKNLSIPCHSCIYSRPQEGQFLGTIFGLDHGVGHFRPLSITRQRHWLTYHFIAMRHEGLCQVF